MIDPTQQSFDKKKPLPPEVRQNCSCEQSLYQLPSCLPARAGAAACLEQHGKPSIQRGKIKKPHQDAGAAEGERLDKKMVFLGVGGITPLAKRCRGKARMLPWDGPLGFCPTDPIVLLPQQGETFPSCVRRKMWPGSIHWGDSGEIFRNFYDVKQHLSLRAFLGFGRGEGSWKKKQNKKKPMGKRSSLPRL